MIMSESPFQKASKVPANSNNVMVLNPACTNTMVPRVPLAPRKFTSLDGKNIYMVDIGWGGPAAAYDIFQVIQDWFARNMPLVNTMLVRKRGHFGEDDPDLWSEIKSKGDACIIGISC
jgi:hypothetical protein